MGLRHFELDVATFAVDGPNEAIDQDQNEEQSEGGVNEGPNDVVPSFGHHRFLHRGREGLRWRDNRLDETVVVFDGLHEFNHVNAAVAVCIDMLHNGNDVELGEPHAREGTDGFAQFLMCDGLGAVGVHLMEHLCDVQVIEGVQQCAEGIRVIFNVVVNVLLEFKAFIFAFSLDVILVFQMRLDGRVLRIFLVDNRCFILVFDLLRLIFFMPFVNSICCLVMWFEFYLDVNVLGVNAWGLLFSGVR